MGKFITINLFLFAFFCRAEMWDDGSNGNLIFIPLDDCPANVKQVVATINFTYWVQYTATSNNGQAQIVGHIVGSAIINSGGNASGGPYGYYDGQFGWLVNNFLPNTAQGVYNWYYTMSVSFAPYNNDGAASAGWSEGGSRNSNPEATPQPPVTYSAYTNNTGCYNGNQMNHSSNTTFGYTNNTATPQQLPDGTILQPGQGTNYTLTWPNGSTGTFSPVNQNSTSGQFNNDTGDYTFNWNTNSTSVQYTNNTVPLSQGAYSDFLASSNGGAIIWAPDASTNAALATEAGDNGIINSENAIQNALNSDISNLITRLNQPLQVTASNVQSSGLASNVWVENWPSNFNSGASASNITLNASNINIGESNVWVQNWPTNINTDTGAVATMLGEIPAYGTNLSQLTNLVASSIGNYGLTSFLNSLSPSIPSDSDPGMSDFVINMRTLGVSFNFDPEVQFPNVMASLRAGWVIILIAWFLYWLSERFFAVVQSLNQARGGSTPDMEVGVEGLSFGVSGNFLGVSLFYVFCGLAITLLSGVLYEFFSLALPYFESSLSSAIDVADWENSLGSDAVHLFAISFPLNLAITLVFARITFNFTLAGIVFWIASCMRFLPIG